MNALFDAVRLSLADAGLLSPESRLLCAVSGGADSTALLHALCRVQRDAGFRLTALHVQHGLRGESSLADERFVRTLCKALSVELIVEQAHLSGDMNTPGMETMARDERRRIFAKQLKLLSAHAILTAHHRDDQTETVLMHLMRGSGLKGLCGMPPSSPFSEGRLIRPFLSITREQIESALQSENLACCTDESNQQLITPRNAIRHSLLPQMEALYPGASAHIAQTAQTLACDEDYLTQEAERLFAAAFYGVPPICALWLAPMQKAHPALRRRVLRKVCGPLSMPDTLKLEALVQSGPGTSVNLPGELMAVRGAEHVHFTRTGPEAGAEPAQNILPKQAQYAFGHCVIHQRDVLAGEKIPSSSASVILTPDVLALGPVLRIPQLSDFIHPLGAAGAKPLRRFFTDRKVDPFFRWQLPVLAIENDVLWAPGLCTAEGLRLSHIPPGAVHLSITELPFIPHQSKE